VWYLREEGLHGMRTEWPDYGGERELVGFLNKMRLEKWRWRGGKIGIEVYGVIL